MIELRTIVPTELVSDADLQEFCEDAKDKALEKGYTYSCWHVEKIKHIVREEVYRQLLPRFTKWKYDKRTWHDFVSEVYGRSHSLCRRLSRLEKTSDCVLQDLEMLYWTEVRPSRQHDEQGIRITKRVTYQHPFHVRTEIMHVYENHVGRKKPRTMSPQLFEKLDDFASESCVTLNALDELVNRHCGEFPEVNKETLKRLRTPARKLAKQQREFARIVSELPRP